MAKILSIIGLAMLLSACANDLPLQMTLGNDAKAKAAVENGADIEAVNSYGTALMIAARTNNVEMVNYLLKKGANVNHGVPQTGYNITPLLWAVEEDALEAAKVLLAHGADATVRTSKNHTLLELAQQKGYQGMAKLLSDYEKQKAAWAKTEKINTLEAYQRFTKSYPDSTFMQTAQDKIAKLKVAEAERKVQQAKLDAMEAKLPVNVRRDKYMVQLSKYLKEQNYKAALEIFPKLESLNIAKDPSLDYFYGEALLKTGNPGGAMQKLYKYINEQGTSAAHYAQALEMVNQAESQL